MCGEERRGNAGRGWRDEAGRKDNKREGGGKTKVNKGEWWIRNLISVDLTMVIIIATPCRIPSKLAQCHCHCINHKLEHRYPLHCRGLRIQIGSSRMNWLICAHFQWKYSQSNLRSWSYQFAKKKCLWAPVSYIKMQWLWPTCPRNSSFSNIAVASYPSHSHWEKPKAAGWVRTQLMCSFFSLKERLLWK